MPNTRTRFADLHSLFRAGSSPFLNDIATISLHYEDFKYELSHLQIGIDNSKAGTDYEAYYWIRRAMLTISEFGKALNSLRSTKENLHYFENMRKDKLQAIDACKRAINKSRIQQLRNYFGGHIDSEQMGKGVKWFGECAISSLSWTEDRNALPLDLKFANDIFRGAFAGYFAKDVTELKDQLQLFYKELGNLFPDVAATTHILVHDFIWVRMV